MTDLSVICTAVFLRTQAYMNGVVIPVDDGWLAR